MPRNLPSLMITEITSNQVCLCFLVDIQLVSGTARVWSGMGSVTWNGNTYTGVGSMGAVGEIAEGSDVKSRGTSIELSGIDQTLLNDTLNDLQIGAPATVWLATFSAGAIQAAVKAFGGTVDRPVIVPGMDTFSIQIALETKMANLQRPTNRRYTLADQRRYYPDDTGFQFVEVLNDIALLWG